MSTTSALRPVRTFRPRLTVRGILEMASSPTADRARYRAAPDAARAGSTSTCCATSAPDAAGDEHRRELCSVLREHGLMPGLGQPSG